MLLAQTPIGLMPVPSWEEERVVSLSDDELLQKAIEENKNFVISPPVFAMIERRFLTYKLQKLINPNVGMRHDLNL